VGPAQAEEGSMTVLFDVELRVEADDSQEGPGKV
jgi:hypothetical protein